MNNLNYFLEKSIDYLEIDESKKAEEFIRNFDIWNKINVNKETSENLIKFKELAEKFLKLTDKLSKDDKINNFISHVTRLNDIVKGVVPTLLSPDSTSYTHPT